MDVTNATLQQWALNNGINATVSNMSQLEKAALRYQYVMTQTGAAQGDFIRTQDTWANQVRILKQNLQQLSAVIGGTLINALKPVVKSLNVVIGKFISFAKVVSDSLGKIFGWKYEESGSTGITDDLESGATAADNLASGIGEAADNAKKLKSYTLGIDELNVVEPDTGNSSSGGSSGGGSTGGVSSGSASQNNWVQTDGIFKNFESQLDSLYKLGDYIGDRLTNTLKNIPWDKVYEGARNFGTGLADFLNGLISPELFGAIGTTIAGGLNTAIYAALSFGETFEWKELGDSIATGINDLFNTFDFASLANAINIWANGILDTIIETFEKIKWYEIGERIGVFLSQLDFVEIGKKVAISIWQGIQGAWELIKGSFSIAPIETALLGLLTLPAIVGFGSNIVSIIATPFTKLQTIMAPAISWISGLFAEGGLFGAGGLIATASTPILVLTGAFAAFAAGLGYVFVKNEEVRESFSDAISTIRDGLQPALEFLTGTLLPDLRDGWDRLLEVLSPLGEFLEKMFTDIWQERINPALTYVGEVVLPKVTEAFENLWNNVLVPLGSFLADILEPVIQIVADVLSILWENVLKPIGDSLGDIGGKIFENLVDVFNQVTEKVLPVIEVLQYLWNNILAPLVMYLWDKLKPVFESTFGAIGGIISGLFDTFGGLIDFVVGVFTGDWEKAWNGVKEIIDGLVKAFEANFQWAWETIKFIFSPAIDFFSGIWEGIKKIFADPKAYFREKFDAAYKNIKEIFTPIVNWFHNKWTAVKEVFKYVREFFGEKFDSAYKKIKEIFTPITNWFKEKWEGIKSAFSGVKEFFSDAFQKAFDAVSKIWNGIGKVFGDVANSIIDPIQKAVNGIINGINWVLDKLGSETRIDAWVSYPKFANGSNGLSKDTVGMVNDQRGSTYKELIVPPHGQPFIPEGRNVLLPLEKGTKIMPANQTKALMNMSNVPQFSRGIGDFFGGLWEKVTSFTGDVMDYFENPGKLVQIAFDKFIDTSRWTGAIASIGAGTINKIFESATNYIKKFFGDSSIEKAVKWAIGIADDNSHGYDQANRTGPDYDCSSLITIALQKAGFDVGVGTTFTMLSQLLSAGFKDVTGSVDRGTGDGMKRGDVLLNPEKHTAMYVGDGKMVHARINEFGGITGGKTGDQTGDEIAVTPYRNHPWTYILRYSRAFKDGIGKISFNDLIPAYSLGGFPEDGLFYANHNELVGQFSNGRTAVANNENIQEGIKQGVKEAVSELLEPYLRDIEKNTRETADKDMTVRIGDRDIAMANKRGTERLGFSFT